MMDLDVETEDEPYRVSDLLRSTMYLLDLARVPADRLLTDDANGSLKSILVLA